MFLVSFLYPLKLIHIHVLHLFTIVFFFLPGQCGWSAGTASTRTGAGDELALHFNTQCCPAPFLAPPNSDIRLWLLHQRTESGHTPGQTALLPGASHCRWPSARQLPHLLQRTHFVHRRLGSCRSVRVGNIYFTIHYLTLNWSDVDKKSFELSGSCIPNVYSNVIYCKPFTGYFLDINTTNDLLFFCY